MKIERFSIDSVLVLGPGPVLIGQGCEFDYSSVQACISLKEEGVRVIAMSSNSASLMTDPSLCDATYIEPMLLPYVEKILEKERPAALLATHGGQVALNLALALKKSGALQRYGVALLGPSPLAIEQAEDRSLFYKQMQLQGLAVAEHRFVTNDGELVDAVAALGFPLIARRGFSLGGADSALITSFCELKDLTSRLFAQGEGLMLDASLLGWKEFEMEIIKDHSGASLVICGIENIDPIGIHTGDSITVAPILTLTDSQYQRMRKMAFACAEAVGFCGGGANVQFALNPKNDQMLIVEMNPRMSRSSALASKATGYPIAKVAAKVAIGYALHEIQGALITKTLPAFYEPVMDYVAVKIPKFQFDKFPLAADRLGPKMQAVGEAMGIGASFPEALLRAQQGIGPSLATESLAPTSQRLASILQHLYQGMTIEEIHDQTGIDLWFLHEMQKISLRKRQISLDDIRLYKQMGFSDALIAERTNRKESDIRQLRYREGIIPSFCYIDATAMEHNTSAMACYSTYQRQTELAALSSQSILIIGSGACRIGQGIEYDALCAQALFRLKERGYPSIMVSDNPGAVSTDYSFSDRLYISPLTLEHILDICHLEKPLGVIITLGGQTALSLAAGLEEAGVKLLGITASQVSLCEDRGAFRRWTQCLALNQPHGAVLYSDTDIPLLRYPVIVRPSFVLGGQHMCFIDDDVSLKRYIENLIAQPSYFPILVEEFLQDAIEVDVDLLCDGKSVYIPSIQEHIEPAGIHSGDSIHCIPPENLSITVQQEIYTIAEKIALTLGVKGIINIQLLVKEDRIFIIEVNPRASRSVPFLSKATGSFLVRQAVDVMLGGSLPLEERPGLSYSFVKRPVFSDHVFIHRDLGPEMLSTGEVMGWGHDRAEAFCKVKGSYDDLGNHSVVSLQHLQKG